MVLKADREKLKTLLRDTVSLLCKNGLAFRSEVCLEALLVFTLDQEETFHVSINETLKSAAGSLDGSGNGQAEGGVRQHRDLADSEDEGPSHNKRQRTLPPVTKTEKVDAPSRMSASHNRSTHDAESYGDLEDSMSAAADDRVSTPPGERYSGESGDSSNDKDIIVIKEELGDDWSELQSQDPGLAESLQAPFDPHTGFRDMGLSSGSHEGAMSMASQSWTDNSRLDMLTASGHDAGTSANSSFTRISQPGQDSSPIGLRMMAGHVTSRRQPGSDVRCDPGPCVCPVCQKSLSSPHNLAKHVRRLHERRFSLHCEVCGKGFMDRTGLRSHMAKHTMVKEFPCPQCDKSYAYKTHLVEHLIDKHGCNYAKRHKRTFADANLN